MITFWKILLTSRPRHTQDLEEFLVFCFVLFCFVVVTFLFFYEQNKETEKFTQKKEQEVELMARDIIITDISKMSELEFKTMIIKIVAGLEKESRRHYTIPFCREKN